MKKLTDEEIQKQIKFETDLKSLETKVESSRYKDWPAKKQFKEKLDLIRNNFSPLGKPGEKPETIQARRGSALIHYASELEKMKNEMAAADQSLNAQANQASQPTRRFSLATPLRRQSNAPSPQVSSLPGSPKLPIRNKRLDAVLQAEGIQPKSSSVSEKNASAVQPASSSPVAQNTVTIASIEEKAEEMVNKIFNEPTIDEQVDQILEEIYKEPTESELKAVQEIEDKAEQMLDKIFEEPTQEELATLEKTQTEQFKDTPKMADPSPEQKDASQGQGVQVTTSSPERRPKNVKLKAEFQRSAASEGQQSEAPAKSESSSASSVPLSPMAKSWKSASVSAKLKDQTAAAEEKQGAVADKTTSMTSMGRK